MKFALVNGERKEAEPGLSGVCPGCKVLLIARCGEVRVEHWSHKGTRTCDPWWENEAEWHRGWKDQFPVGWQEIVQHAPDGEKHIADIKTDRDWVIEIQHSYLKPEERRSRDKFYGKLVWVVDATRRKTDATRFAKAMEHGTWVVAKPPILIRRVFSEDCALLREWADSPSPVFFDFGNDKPLAWLITGRSDGSSYIGPVSRTSFVNMHGVGRTETTRDFEELVKDFRGLITDYESYLRRMR